MMGAPKNPKDGSPMPNPVQAGGSRAEILQQSIDPKSLAARLKVEDSLLLNDLYTAPLPPDKELRSIVCTLAAYGRAEHLDAFLGRLSATEQEAVLKGEFTALHYASVKGNLDTFGYLQQHLSPAQIGVRLSTGETSFDLALRNGHRALLERMLSAYAMKDLDPEPKKGGCPRALHRAVKHADNGCLEYLLTYKKEELTPWLTMQDETGATPFHEAVMHNKLHALKVMLRCAPRDAEIKADASGKIPLRSALIFDLEDCAMALIDKMAESNPSALIHGMDNSDTRGHLLYDVLERGDPQMRPLHMAAALGRTRVVEKLCTVLEKDVLKKLRAEEIANTWKKTSRSIVDSHLC